MDLKFLWEKREQIDPVPETSEGLKRLLRAVAYARDGAPFYAYCHPDYYTVPDQYYPGAFPTQVQERIWTHIGFKGSLEPNAERSHTPEIHGLWLLKDSMYVYFVFTDGETPTVKATFASSKIVLENKMPPNILNVYFKETRPVLPKFTPPCSPLLNGSYWNKENSCSSSETDDDMPPLVAPSPRPEFQEPLYVKLPVSEDEKIDLGFLPR